MVDVNIFPFVEVPPEIEETIEEENELPMAREYAWDFEEMDFKYKNGKMYFVEGNEAVEIWLWKLFKTSRFRELIFSWDYGHELEELVGKGYTPGFLNSEAERYVREAIEYNLSDYVIDVENMDVAFTDSTLSISATAITPYGEVEFIG